MFRSQKYKDVIEAVDIVQDMRVQCDKCLTSLTRLDEYLSEKRCFRHSVSEQNRKSDADTGRKLSAIISAIPLMYATLQSSDFSSTTKLFLESFNSLREIRDHNVPSKQLVVEVEKSLNRVKSFVALAAGYELEKLPEIDSLVITALVSLIAVNRQTISQTFDTLLASVSSSIRNDLVPSKHPLSHALVQYYRALHFLLRTTSDMFLADQPLNLMAYISRKYNGVECGNVLSDGEIRGRLAVWWQQQESFLQQVLPDFLRNMKAVDILQALHEVSQFNGPDRRSDWDRNCICLLDKRCCFWNDSLRNKMMDKIRSTITGGVDEAVSCLSVSSIADGTVNMSSFVWTTSEDDDDFELKRLALIPELKHVMFAFKQTTSQIRMELDLLTGDHQGNMSLISEPDWIAMKSTAADLFDAKLESFLRDLVRLTKSQSSKVLPACFLVKCIALSQSGLKSICAMHADPSQWDKMRTKLLRQSYSWLSIHFSRRIEQFSAHLLKVSELSVDQITESSMPWEETILKDGNESGTAVTSVIRTPVYPSISFMDFLSLISREVNQISGHGLSDEVSVAILLKAGIEISRVYRETLDRIVSSQMPVSMLQRKSLQCYFDLLVSKAILTPIRSEQIRNTFLPKLATLIKSFEVTLDPFDLHLMSSTIHRNVNIAIRNSNHILCLFVPEAALESVKKSVDSKVTQSASNDNLRSKHSCPVLPLLPLNK